jgi:hypothetical protein
MTESAQHSRRNDQRRRQVILWTTAAVLIILLLLLLGYCTRDNDGTDHLSGPPAGLPSATSTSPSPGSAPVQPPVDYRSESASAEPNDPSAGSPSSVRTTVAPPRGGAGTGGGSRAPGGGQLVALGMLALLGAAGAAAYAARPSRSRP